MSIYLASGEKELTKKKNEAQAVLDKYKGTLMSCHAQDRFNNGLLRQVGLNAAGALKTFVTRDLPVGLIGGGFGLTGVFLDWIIPRAPMCYMNKFVDMMLEVMNVKIAIEQIEILEKKLLDYKEAYVGIRKDASNGFGKHNLESLNIIMTTDFNEFHKHPEFSTIVERDYINVKMALMQEIINASEHKEKLLMRIQFVHHLQAKIMHICQSIHDTYVLQRTFITKTGKWGPLQNIRPKYWEVPDNKDLSPPKILTHERETLREAVRNHVIEKFSEQLPFEVWNKLLKQKYKNIAIQMGASDYSSKIPNLTCRTPQHLTEAPRIKQILLYISDSANAGSTVTSLKVKICITNTDKCCLSGPLGPFTRRKEYTADTSEALGQCQDFRLTSTQISFYFNNPSSNAVIINRIRIFDGTDIGDVVGNSPHWRCNTTDMYAYSGFVLKADSSLLSRKDWTTSPMKCILPYCPLGYGENGTSIPQWGPTEDKALKKVFVGSKELCAQECSKDTSCKAFEFHVKLDGSQQECGIFDHNRKHGCQKIGCPPLYFQSAESRANLHSTTYQHVPSIGKCAKICNNKKEGCEMFHYNFMNMECQLYTKSQTRRIGELPDENGLGGLLCMKGNLR